MSEFHEIFNYLKSERFHLASAAATYKKEVGFRCKQSRKYHVACNPKRAIMYSPQDA